MERGGEGEGEREVSRIVAAQLVLSRWQPSIGGLE